MTCKAVRYDSRCIILAPPDSMLLHNTFLLTLSQLEPQIHLKSNLLIFVISVFGISSGNIDALYIIRGIINLFTIVILPIKVRLREDHKLKIFFILFNKDSKFNSTSFFRIVITIFDRHQNAQVLKSFRQPFYAFVNKELIHAISVATDVKSLTFGQNLFYNCCDWKIPAEHQIYEKTDHKVPDKKSKTSSANIVNFNISWSITTPWYIVSYFKTFAKHCIDNTKIVGDKGSPCRTPVETSKKEDM